VVVVVVVVRGELTAATAEAGEQPQKKKWQKVECSGSRSLHTNNTTAELM
jgi:hypothetical protein